MIVREIHTFYEPIDGDSKEACEHRAECDKVLQMWKDSWYAHGWNPIVLGANDAREHPAYQQVMDKVHSMPSAHEEHYNDRCYQRWLALANVGGWYADPDMINYNFPPPDVWGQSISLCPGTACPSVIKMSKDEYDTFFINTILDYEWKDGDDFVHVNQNGDHVVNDMLVLHNRRVHRAFSFSMHVMGEYGRHSFHGVPVNDEEHASIVHYSGPYIGLEGWQRKSDIIASVKRPWPKRWL